MIGEFHVGKLTVAKNGMKPSTFQFSILRSAATTPG
jgi:hypothetical protein